MTLREFMIVSIIVIGCLAAPSSRACSWVISIQEDQSRFVFVGRIVAHVAEQKESRLIFGIEIEPMFSFQIPDTGTKANYTAFPHGVGADCSSRYAAPSATLADRYAIGSLAAIWGNSAPEAQLGDISVMWNEGLEILPSSCSAEDAAATRGNYFEDRPVCGSVFFHAFKDLGQLRNSTETEAFEVLTRLSKSNVFTHFEELVDKYVRHQDQRDALMLVRYKEVIEFGCEKEPEYEHDQVEPEKLARSGMFRTRWYEYCAWERHKAAKNDG